MMPSTSIRLMRSLVAGALLGLALLVAHAGPKEDIQADMKAGRWAQAEERLVVVLEKHPNNPLAHYWRAQVKAKLGDMAAARDELAAAKRIDPSLKFAGSREALERLESRIAEPAPAQSAAAAASPADLVAPMTVPQGVPAQPVALESRLEDSVEPMHNRALGYLGWMLAILVAGGIVVFVGSFVTDRRDRKKSLQEARERWAAQLRDAKADLEDAIKKSDGNVDLPPETKLGNYDRCNSARNAVAAQLGAVQKAEDFREAQMVVVRSHDIAAEVRGEETPTARAERQRREADERAARLEASRPREVHHHHESSYISGGGSSLLRDAALIGGGVLLANALTNSARADSHHSGDDDRRQTFEPIASSVGNDSNDVDIGGTVAGGDDSFDASTPAVDNDFN
jgi:tetratricopeptide (TPR) repeat protein